MHECVFERVWEIVPFEDDNICPYLERNKMEIQKNKVCGADIHKKFIMGTILSRDETKIRDWIPIYTVLEGSIEVTEGSLITSSLNLSYTLRDSGLGELL